MNKNKLLKWAYNGLAIIGGFTILSLIIIFIYSSLSFTLFNKNKVNKATKSDVGFVLNWCGIGDDRINKVINSYESARSFTGDHLDAYAIKLNNVSIDDITNRKNYKWYRCDKLPDILDKSVSFIDGWTYEIPWFPKKMEQSNYYLYPWSTYFNGVTPSSAQLIFLDVENEMIYYISAKM